MIEVRVSEDGMQAEVAIYPEEGEVFSEVAVREALQLEGVQAGIDDSVIEHMIKERLFSKSVVVAKGVPPVNGIDGKYDFFFITEEENKLPKIQENGTVDYTRTITNVNEGDLLAEYHPRTVGTNGYNVFSTAVPAVAGKELKPLKCKNVNLDGTKYYAAASGYVKKDGNAITIEAVLEINGDVDQTVGNLDFNGDIHVLGSVMSSMNIKAQGSIIVDGVIESAKVEAGKDIIVSKGIHGQGVAEIKALGDVTSNFIDHALVSSGGNIVFNYAVNSVVIAEGMVKAQGKRASIVGGKVVATAGVDAGTYGNPAEIPTKIYVGVSHLRQKQLQNCKKQLKELEERIDGCDEKDVPELISKMIKDVRIKILELEKRRLSEKSSPIIVRAATYPGVSMYLNEVLAGNLNGMKEIELRNIDSKIICKKIGGFTAADFAARSKPIKEEILGVKLHKVLAIDDDVRMLRTINEMLKSEYEVAAAKSGQEARNYLKNRTVDLILLDYMMPFENGVEVLKSLRANEKTAKIPVVFLTGLDDKKKILECLSLKPAGYVVKPVDKEKLVKKLKAVLGVTE